jgi:lysophospholipase L1-like esterase
MRWTVLVRPEEDSGQLTLRAGGRAWVARGEPEVAEAVEPLAMTFEGDGGLELALEHAVARPRVFGVIIESAEPGVVVDTLGINGARIQTALAWAEEPWVRAVARRSADLVIVAYGTNEVFDALAPERYRPMYEALLARIRRGAPTSACWLVGPTDVGRGGRQADARVAQIERVQREVARRNGCLYFSPASAMGGSNGFERWLRERPPLAVNDGVHLAKRGYRRLGDQMASVLVEGYEDYCERAGRAANSR